MNSNSQLLESLATSQTYKDYEKAYNEATGLPVTLRPVESWQLPLHGRRNESGFCALMARKSRTCAACLQLQKKVEESAQLEPKTLKCFAGLCDSAVPVRVGENLIAFLQTGQVLLHQPTRQEFAELLASPGARGVLFDGDGGAMGFALWRVTLDEAELLAAGEDKRAAACPALAAAPPALMRLSESRRKVPETAMRSPALKPLRTSTRPPRRRPRYRTQGAGLRAAAASTGGCGRCWSRARSRQPPLTPIV